MPTHQDLSPPDWFPRTSGRVRAFPRVGAIRAVPRTIASVRTDHFTLTWEDGSAATVEYDLPLRRIDNSLAKLVADELGETFIAATPDQLADVITAIVLSTNDDPAVAWSGFYDRTLARLSARRGEADHVGDQVEVFASIYRYAAQLVRGHSVLDVASCLGFWPLLLATRGYHVTAVDTDRRAMALLAIMARRRKTQVHTLVGNATRLPCRSGAVATATSIHLLEHLDVADATRTVDELLRVCVDRAIIAVPLEKRPTAAFGHLRCFDLSALRELGAAHLGRYGVSRVTVTEHHGGWLVLDKDKLPGAAEHAGVSARSRQAALAVRPTAFTPTASTRSGEP
jgi:SAM-dependent methyltransferase